MITCENCNGACCMAQGAPPGFAAHILADELGVAEHKAIMAVEPDGRIVAEIPESIRAEFAEMFRAHDYDSYGQCFWLDMKTRQCKHYAHRPDACREAVAPGDEACLSWREDYPMGAANE